MPANRLLEAALAYAGRGWPVFPCRADKTPYTDGGVLEATTDAQAIEAWWGAWPRANIGLDVGGAGMMALDLDPGHAPEDVDRLLADSSGTGLRQTTPRGGEHLFFELRPGELVSPSASKLAPHIDVRSFHSYVLLPPSRTDAGTYEWQEEGKPAFRSDELVRLCNAAREKSTDRDEWIIEPDMPENVAAAVAWLKQDARIAVEGQGGDSEAYATAAHMKSFGISRSLAFDLIWEHWNPRCAPPWSADEADHLETKIDNAYAYNTSPPGNITDAYKLARRESLFQPVAHELPEGREMSAGRFRFVDREGMGHIRPPAWIIPGFLPEQAYAMLFGAPESYKTFVAIDAALSIATGAASFPWRGLWPAIENPGPAMLAVGEGRSQIVNRVTAWERMHWGGEKVRDFVLSDPVPLVGEDIDPFIDGALALHPDGYRLVVLDTVGRAMQGLNENAQENASKFTAMVERLQAELGCAVLAIHHTGHDDKERARGSSVFLADADVSVRADNLGNGRGALAMLKQKDAEHWPEPKHFSVRKIQVTEEASSLTVLAAEAPAGKGAQSPADEAARAFGGKPRQDPNRADDSFYDMLDDLVKETLSSVPGKSWTTSNLAETLAMREDIDTGSSVLRTTHLVRLREDSERQANRLYNPVQKRWLWRG